MYYIINTASSTSYSLLFHPLLRDNNARYSNEHSSVEWKTPKEAELELLLRRFSGPTTELSGMASCDLDILAKDIHCKVPFYRHRLTLTVIARYLVSLGLYSRASLHRGIRIVIISVLKTAISESESVLVDFDLDTFPLCNGNDESSSRHRCGTIHFNGHRRNTSEYVPYSLCSQSYPLLLQKCKVHQQTIKC